MPSFKALVNQYGEEFYFNDSIDHPGTFPSASSFFSLSLKTGNLVTVLSDEPGTAVPLALEIKLGKWIFASPSSIALEDKSSAEPPEKTFTLNVAILLGIPPLALGTSSNLSELKQEEVKKGSETVKETSLSINTKDDLGKVVQEETTVKKGLGPS